MVNIARFLCGFNLARDPQSPPLRGRCRRRRQRGVTPQAPHPDQDPPLPCRASPPQGGRSENAQIVPKSVHAPPPHPQHFQSLSRNSPPFYPRLPRPCHTGPTFRQHGWPGMTDPGPAGGGDVRGRGAEPRDRTDEDTDTPAYAGTDTTPARTGVPAPASSQGAPARTGSAAVTPSKTSRPGLCERSTIRDQPAARKAAGPKPAGRAQASQKPHPNIHSGTPVVRPAFRHLAGEMREGPPASFRARGFWRGHRNEGSPLPTGGRGFGRLWFGAQITGAAKH